MVSKAYYYWVLIIAIIGIAGSILIHPKPHELAFMRMQDKYFEDALAEFNKLREQGDLSLSVVVPLSKLYLQYGRVDDAIGTLEDFIRENPEYVEARKQLGIYYQYAQRPGDYLQNLEKIKELEPSGEVLRELANIYNFYGSYDKQTLALEELVENFKPVEKDFINLAYLYASQGQVEKAVSILDDLFEVYRYNVSPDTVEFAISLYTDIGQSDKALHLASDFINQSRNVSNAVRFASRLHGKGDAESAMQLMKPFEKHADDDVAFLAQYIELQIDNGQQNVAYEKLHFMAKEDILPQLVLDQYLFLLAEREDVDAISDILDSKKYDFNLISESTILDVLYAIALKKQPKVAYVLDGKLNDIYTDRYAVVDAMLELVEGKPSGISKTRELLLSDAVNEHERIKIAKISSAVNNDQLVSLAMQGFVKYGASIDRDQLFDIAELYFELERLEEGYRYFDNFKKSQPGIHHDEVEHIWALLATAIGKEQQVVDWLKDKQPSELALIDIFEKALQYQRKDVAMVVGTRLYEMSQTKLNKRFYADALLMNGREEEALSHYQELIKFDTSKFVVDGYITALERVIKKTPEPQKSELKQSLFAYLTKQLDDEYLSIESRRNIGYALLEFGWKEEGEQVFFDLAKDAKPSSPDVGQLLYLWGPRPKPERIAWIRKRTESATAEERVGWYSRLLEAGQREYVIKMIEEDGYYNHPPQIRDMYLGVLLDKKRYRTLRQYLSQEIPRERQVKRLSYLGRTAQAADMIDLTQQAFAKILAIGPGNIEALRELALLSYYQGNYSLAREYFNQLFERKQNHDHYIHFAYGDMLEREFRYSEAQDHYKKALAHIETIRNPDIITQAMKAVILTRTGKLEEGLELYDNLIARPDATLGMRAEYANLLMDAGRYKRAEEVLFGERGAAYAR